MGTKQTIEQSKQAVTLYAEWPLRIVFASVFMFHGISKLTGDMQGFADFAGVSLGLAWVAALAEVFVGLFVFIGGFSFPYHGVVTRVGAVLAIPVMVVAIAGFHWPRWFFTPTEEFPMGGMMFQVTLILASLYFLASTGRIREHFEPTPLPENGDGDAKVRAVAKNTPIGAHWFLRVALGAVFITMGFNKFGTLDDFSAMMGMTEVTAFALAFVECAAGTLILLGGTRTEFADNASRIGGLLIVPIMIGAIAKVHFGRWNFTPAEGFPMGGAEFQTLLMMIGLFFVLRGRPETGPVAETQTTGA